MKKTIKATVLLVLVPLLLIPIPVHAEKEASGLSLSAKAAFLYEAQSQTALFAKNEDARMPMASTTKIMTALAALSALSLDDDFCIPKEAVGVEGSSAYYRVGETVKIRDLFYALLLLLQHHYGVFLFYEQIHLYLDFHFLLSLVLMFLVL